MRALTSLFILLGGCMVGEPAEFTVEALNDDEEDSDGIEDDEDDSGYDFLSEGDTVGDESPLIRAAAAGYIPAGVPASTSLTWGSSGFEDPSITKYGIPISKGSTYGNAKVLYSVPIPSYTRGTLVVRGGFMVSKCGKGDLQGGGDIGGPCDKYATQVSPYAPEIGARLILANGAQATTGTPITGWFEQQCTDNKHHCGMAVNGLWTGTASATHVNLIVGAKANGANSWNTNDLVELESDCKSSYANCPISDQLTPWQQGSKGRLDVTRFGVSRGGDAQLINWGKAQAKRTQMSLPQSTSKTTGYMPIFIAPIAVSSGDVIDVDATLTSHVSGGQSNHRSYVSTTAALVAVAPSAASSLSLTAAGRYVTSKNGRNCKRGDACAIRKTGSIVVPTGSPATMYLVVAAMGKVVGGSTNNTWTLDSAQLAVFRRRP